MRPPRDTTADEGGPLSLSATFLGNPIPDVTWLKDGEPLSPSDRVKITCDGKKVEPKGQSGSSASQCVFVCFQFGRAEQGKWH